MTSDSREPPPATREQREREYNVGDVTTSYALQTHARDSPERALLRAILADALNILSFRPAPEDRWPARERYQETLSWFRGEIDSVRGCSFAEICVELEIGDPKEVAERVLRSLEEPPAVWRRGVSLPSYVRRLPNTPDIPRVRKGNLWRRSPGNRGPRPKKLRLH